MIKRLTFFSIVVSLLSFVFVPLAGTEMKGQTKVEASPDDPAATEVDRKFIRRAFEIAREAVAKGNRPYGALLVHEGKILAEDSNTVNQTGDITKHAESGLLALATQKYSRDVLSQSTLYASGEPCLMCRGAINWARLSRLVYGSSAVQTNKVYGRQSRGIPIKETFERTNPNLTLVGPVLEEEGLKVHIDFTSK